MHGSDSCENMVAQQKRKALRLETKYDIIKQLQCGVKQSEVYRQLGISKSTVSTIWKEKEKILGNFLHKNSNVKKIRKPSHDKPR